MISRRNAILAEISPTERTLVTLFAYSLLFVCAVAYVATNRALVSSGGSAFLQGEWLINYGAGFVRRGASGFFAISVADATGISPLVVVEILQSGMVLLIIAGIILSLWKIGSPPLLLILSISPAFVVFWLNNYGVPTKDIHGKEMLGYLAFLPILHAAANRNFLISKLVLSGLIYVAAVLFYEPNIFFAIPLILSAYILQLGREKSIVYYVFSLALLIVVAVLVFLTVRFSEVANPEAMCAEIIQRGVDRSICNKFGWNSETLEHALAFTSGRTGMRSVLRTTLAISFAMLPVLVLFAQLRRNRILYSAILLQAAAFVPLYFMGIDYGRWLSIQVSSIILLILVALLAGKFPELRQSSARILIWPLLVLSVVWGLQPIYGGVEIGAVKYVAPLLGIPR